MPEDFNQGVSLPPERVRMLVQHRNPVTVHEGLLLLAPDAFAFVEVDFVAEKDCEHATTACYGPDCLRAWFYDHRVILHDKEDATQHVDLDQLREEYLASQGVEEVIRLDRY